MKWIYDLSYEQLKEEISRIHTKKFVADQVFQWIYEKKYTKPSKPGLMSVKAIGIYYQNNMIPP